MFVWVAVVVTVGIWMRLYLDDKPSITRKGTYWCVRNVIIVCSFFFLINVKNHVDIFVF